MWKEKKIELDVRVCDSVFSQARGLMFRRKSLSLLFVFKNVKKRAIHSFFCKPFYAIWFDGDKIIDEKLVFPWRFSVFPKKGFDKLLEIPVGDAIRLNLVGKVEKGLNTKRDYICYNK